MDNEWLYREGFHVIEGVIPDWLWTCNPDQRVEMCRAMAKKSQAMVFIEAFTT